MMQQPTYLAAQLNAVFVEPLRHLERQLLAHHAAIEDWFASQWQQTLAPAYASVDLRNAGFKLAPIDMNLFPAGFNNLNPDFLNVAIQAAKKIILQRVPHAKKILLIPEAHTRNLFYWSNVLTLKTILEGAGFLVRLGAFDETMATIQTITVPEGCVLTIEQLVRRDDHLFVADFDPDLILLNNDLSAGIPALFENLKQPLIPPAALGWSQRLKSHHFQYYADVCDEFAGHFNFDPWLISPLFRHCGAIDFMAKDFMAQTEGGMSCLISHAEQLFAAIEKKYAMYHIKQPPFLVIKADAGTYGMAVMTIRHADELKSLNRKQRTRMATIKGGQAVRKVIIQEGIYTFETVGPEKSVAEPVVYLWGEEVVGGFYRVHKERGVDENLNAPGMAFQPFPFTQNCNAPSLAAEPDACCNRFFVYGVVARLSMLAAAREMQALL